MDAKDIIDELKPQLRGIALQKEDEAPPVQLTEEETPVYDSIGYEPVTGDFIAEKSSSPPSKIASPLLLLELKGLIRRLPGNKYVRI